MAPNDVRLVRHVIDGHGLYFSRLAACGSFAFLASVPVDAAGAFAVEAEVHPPYAHCPPAHMAAQTTYIFDQYRRALQSIGSSIADIVQVEQLIPHKLYADSYLETSRAPGYLERDRPASALIATGDLVPEGTVINPTAIAVIPQEGFRKEVLPSSPGYHATLAQPQYGDTFSREAAYNEVVTAGPYVFTVGDTAADDAAGTVAAEVRVPDYVWWGSEIRLEAEFLLTRLETYLAKVDAALKDVVHVTIYLVDLADLYELDKIWRRRFPIDPPARTVIPVRGLGNPRVEAPGLGHADHAVRMEHLALSIRPGFGAIKEIVDTAIEPLQHESVAVKAGPLLWTSGLYAGGREGLGTAAEPYAQLAHIFRQLDQICRDSGTSVQNLLRLRAFVTDASDAYAVYETLRQAVPRDPPAVAISHVPGPLAIPGCTMVLDAIAYVPD